jgi:hypothetical protein
MEPTIEENIVLMNQFNRYQDDKETRARIILSKAFSPARCDEVGKEFKELLQKLG